MAGLVLAEDIPDDELIVENVRLELEEEEQREGLDESYLLDEGKEEEEEDQVQVAPKKKGRRGADLPWEEFDTFKSKEEFDQSVLPDMLTTGFTRRSGKHGDIQTWHCKFARRKGYLCQTKYKVTFSASSENVYVETVGADHNHEVDINIEHEGGNLCWTAEQTKVVVTGILNEAKPAVIRRNLKEYFPEGKMPTAGQLSNKISHCKNNLNEVKQVVTTGGLRKLIEEYKEPDDNDEHKMYIGFSEVVDDQGEANVRFTIVFTTPALAARMSTELIQDDTTYRYFYHLLFCHHLTFLLSHPCSCLTFLLSHACSQAPVAGLPRPGLRQVLLHGQVLPHAHHPAVGGGHEGLREHVHLRQGHPGGGAQGQDGGRGQGNHSCWGKG